MSTPNSQLAYQEAAVGNAGPIELIVMLYDILARDLQKAIAAMEAGNIELRTKHLKHGFLALLQLEGTLNLDEGGELETTMSRFYSMLRSQMLKAQVEQDPALLQELIRLLFSVREAWVELKAKQAPAESQPAQKAATSPYSQGEVRSVSWNS